MPSQWLARILKAVEGNGMKKTAEIEKLYGISEGQIAEWGEACVRGNIPGEPLGPVEDGPTINNSSAENKGDAS